MVQVYYFTFREITIKVADCWNRESMLRGILFRNGILSRSAYSGTIRTGLTASGHSLKCRISGKVGIGFRFLKSNSDFFDFRRRPCKKIRLKSDRDRVGNRKSQNWIPKTEIRFQLSQKSDTLRSGLRL